MGRCLDSPSHILHLALRLRRLRTPLAEVLRGAGCPLHRRAGPAPIIGDFRPHPPGPLLLARRRGEKNGISREDTSLGPSGRGRALCTPPTGGHLYDPAEGRAGPAPIVGGSDLIPLAPFSWPGEGGEKRCFKGGHLPWTLRQGVPCTHNWGTKPLLRSHARVRDWGRCGRRPGHGLRSGA